MRFLGPALIFGLALAADAQIPAPCRGPAELEQAIAAKATVEAYDAMGAWFAGHNQTSCALAAFQAAVSLDPKSGEAHYNLALLLMQTRDFAGAAQHLQTAVHAK